MPSGCIFLASLSLIQFLSSVLSCLQSNIHLFVTQSSPFIACNSVTSDFTSLHFLSSQKSHPAFHISRFQWEFMALPLAPCCKPVVFDQGMLLWEDQLLCAPFKTSFSTWNPHSCASRMEGKTRLGPSCSYSSLINSFVKGVGEINLNDRRKYVDK